MATTLTFQNQIMMPSTIIRRKMFFITQSAFSVFNEMKSGVFRLANNSKVTKRVVFLVSVFMVDNFGRFQKSTQFFFKDKAVFSNITRRVSERVFRFSNKLVARAESYASFRVVSFSSLKEFRNIAGSAITSFVSSFKVGFASKCNNFKAICAFFINHKLIVAN